VLTGISHKDLTMYDIGVIVILMLNKLDTPITVSTLIEELEQLDPNEKVAYIYVTWNENSTITRLLKRLTGRSRVSK
jgi:hypothetical protein